MSGLARHLPSVKGDVQAVKSQAALAAAKARFEQQQKENEAIAERNKRQRLGLPALPPPIVQEVSSKS